LDNQKADQKEVLTEILEQLETELHFLTRVIVGDESWFSKYDPETKRKSEEWNTPVSKTEESSHEQIKNQENGHYFFSILIRKFIKKLYHLVLGACGSILG
jgi:hypothetical protein